jgi:oligopeptide transport system ATP-binding protein
MKQNIQKPNRVNRRNERLESDKVPLLEVKGLKMYYPVPGGIIPHAVAKIHAVDGLDLNIYEGEILGLVGESGCGKSTLGRLIAGLEQPTQGQIFYKGERIDSKSARQMRKIRAQIQMVFQDPYSSLNPRKRIYDIIADPMLYHGLCTKANAGAEVDRLLDLVGLPKNSKERFPHEFSGGQRQRIGIARALSLKPKLIICDEPVSALDVSIQAQILNLLKNLQKEFHLTYLFIGHGLDAVHYVSNRIAVMYLGKIVEIADADRLFRNPVHPYTKALCNAAPIPDPTKRNRDKNILEGEIPSPVIIPSGCRFHPRCPYAVDQCKRAVPELAATETDSSHRAACIVFNKNAGKGDADD